MERVIVFMYKGGGQCTHTPDLEDDDWWEFISEIIDEMKKERPGILISKSPFGIHKLTDVEAIHFGDVTPPLSSDIAPMGFVKG